jgi:hypothetical protein
MPNYIELRPPNNQTRILSVVVVVSFILALVVGGYVVSLDKGEITEQKFTVSRALANGDKYTMISLFSVSLIATLLLNYIRAGKTNLLLLRMIMITSIYAMVFSIIWITVAVDKKTHFAIAGAIFTVMTLYIFLVSYIFNKYLEIYDYRKIFLDLNIVLLYASFVLLLVFGIYDASDKSEFNSIVFASNENISILLNFIPIVFLGFV